MGVAVIEKTFQLLETLAQSPAPLPLRDLASGTNLPKPTAYRLLQSLQQIGYVVRSEGGGEYLLGEKFRLLAATSNRNPIVEAARPLMRQLHEQFDETINLGQNRAGEVEYLDFLETNRPLRLVVQPNEGDPLYCTALGRAILSALPEEEVVTLLTEANLVPKTAKTVVDREKLAELVRKARRCGYAREDEETNEGVVCLAFSLAYLGFRHAAISVSIPTPRASTKRLEEIAKSFPTYRK